MTTVDTHILGGDMEDLKHYDCFASEQEGSFNNKVLLILGNCEHMPVAKVAIHEAIRRLRCIIGIANIREESGALSFTFKLSHRACQLLVKQSKIQPIGDEVEMRFLNARGKPSRGGSYLSVPISDVGHIFQLYTGISLFHLIVKKEIYKGGNII